jgi:hypothetical protein
MSSIVHKLGAGLAALALLATSAGCASGTSPASEATATSGSEASTAAAVEDTAVRHTTTEVKAALDAFFLEITVESDAYMQESMLKPQGEATDEERAAQLKAAFPKSLTHTDMDERKAMGLIGMFAVVAMLTPDTEITANESGIELDGDEAAIRGSDIKIKGIENSGQGGDGGKIGRISLTYQDSAWKITDVEVKAD